MTVTDPTDLEHDYRTAIADAEALQRRLSATAKDDPQREAVKTELAAAVERGRNAKEALKQLTARRNFAGLGSPLHLACMGSLPDDVVAELEEEAMAILTERERRAAERRAAKAAATPAVPTMQAVEAPAPPPRTMVSPAPEVYRVLPRASPSPQIAQAPSTPRPPSPARPPSRRNEVADLFADAKRVGR
jgi:hypothetical protein